MKTKFYFIFISNLFIFCAFIISCTDEKQKKSWNSNKRKKNRRNPPSKQSPTIFLSMLLLFSHTSAWCPSIACHCLSCRISCRQYRLHYVQIRICPRKVSARMLTFSWIEDCKFDRQLPSRYCSHTTRAISLWSLNEVQRKQWKKLIFTLD